MSREFVTPEFLENCGTDEMHKIGLSEMPKDLDQSRGNDLWNLTRPPALIGARICEFILPQVIRMIFPSWSYGSMLDEHGKSRRIKRRAATAATGEITITGAKNTFIPAGSQFSTASINDIPAVLYSTLADAAIPESGSVIIPIQCTELGTVGNTDANTIIFVASRISGITGVTNEKEITGGTEEENDESMIERIEEYDASLDYSFVGCPADYRRWAMSVPGVGNADVIPAQDDRGIVTIILTDANGDPATPTLCEAVYNYIMQPNDKYARMANTNALLSVIPPETISIGIQAVIELEADYTIEAVEKAFMNKLSEYLPIALSEKEIKLSEIAARLADTEGINDFDIFGLRVGVEQDGVIAYGTDNIPLNTNHLPTIKIENLQLTVAE